MISRARRILAAAGVAAAIGGLSGCSGTVSLMPAADANNPLCAAVSVRLPDAVDGFARRWTDAQATAACGVQPPGPTTLDCQTVDGVDWIVDDSEAPNYRFTTYGRTPAVEVYLDYDPERTSSADILRSIAPAVSQLPVDAKCTARSGQ